MKYTDSTTQQRFTAKVYKKGINPCIAVPRRVSKAFGIRGPVPVQGTLNGHPIRARLLRGEGQHLLYLNKAMQKQVGVGPGDRVVLVLALDAAPIDIKKPLWACPKCGRRFTNRNQWHSCGRYTVEDFLRGKTPYAVSLYNTFVEKLRSIGKIEISPAKTRVAFQARMRFAAINRIGGGYIDGHLILKKRHRSKKFRRVELAVIHHFKITSAEEIDEEFVAFMKEAYSVGMQENL